MNMLTIKKLLLSRLPLAAPAKLAVTALLSTSVLCGALSLLVKNPNILIVAILMWLAGLLIITGIRWAPLLGSLVSAAYLYVFMFTEPFPPYHLAHPRDAFSDPRISFVTFTIITLILWWMLVALVASTGILLQNYRQQKQQPARWFASTLTGLIGLLLGVLLLGAFAPMPDTTATAATTAGGEAVAHMGISSFSQASVNVAKGSRLLIVDDGAFHHNLSNGTWANGQPQPEKLAGEPGVSNLDITGKNVEIGPFTTAGTYHLYCSLHSGMTLTIIVQ